MTAWLPSLTLLSVLLLFVLCGLMALALHKIKRIHLATFDIRPARIETEALFSQLQALLSLERMLDMAKPLPPMRGWAGSPDFLLRVAQTLQTKKPSTVLECSSGVSTVVSARIMQMSGNGHVYSLEHEPEYAKKTRELLMQFGLSDWATVVDAPLVKGNSSTPWYSLAQLPENFAKIDALIIDGPPAAIGSLARYPAMPNLADRFSPDAVVIVDDAARPDEVVMLKKWAVEFPDFAQTDLYCEKGCILLERKA